MLLGIQDLRRAQAYLADQELELAAEHVWKSMFFVDQWPEALQEKAAALLPLLFKAGPIKTTIRQISASERVMLRLQLLSLIEEALQAEGGLLHWKLTGISLEIADDHRD